MQIQISWLLKKPADLELYCLQRQSISGFSSTRVNIFILVTFTCFDAVYTTVSAAINTESSSLFPDPSVPTDSLPLCAFSRQYSCKSGEHELSSISRYDWERFARYVIYFSSSGYMHTAHACTHIYTSMCIYSVRCCDNSTFYKILLSLFLGNYQRDFGKTLAWTYTLSFWGGWVRQRCCVSCLSGAFN